LKTNMKRVGALGFGIALMGCALGLAYHASGQSKPTSGVGITRIVIARRHPAFGGKSFGSAGPYEMLVGTAYGELDPKAPMNRGIVNLQFAPVNAKGHVEYSMDITFLKPVDINKGNGRLIYDVINRGHEKALSDLNLSEFSRTGPEEVNDPATAFIMKRGYTVAWSGWEGERSDEVLSHPGLLKADFPIAIRNGKPITGVNREEITDTPAGPSFTKLLSYPAANLDKAAASLTVREKEADPRKPLPSSSWNYIDATHVRIDAAPGFDRGALYEFIYPATNPIVEGMAYASIRDFVLFLRHAASDSAGQPNPLLPASPFKAILGMGVSESGQVVKDFVYQDFNIDDSGRKVFDGIMGVVSGSGKIQVNAEFAQPGRVSRQHEDHLYPDDEFPFTYATTTDPITGKTDGILLKCTKSHSCPKMFQIDTDTEVWQRRVSLVVTDPSGKASVPIPDNIRVYRPTGMPHNSNDLEETNAGTADRGICKELRSPLHYRFYGRALFVALDRWVTEGVQPPPSLYPNLKNGTLITMEEAAKIWPAIPGVPFSPVINRFHLMDFSHQPPVELKPEYPLFVPRTNADGNPIGGIEPPEVSVPLGTYSGRNPRAKGFAEGELCNLAGSYIPFAVTKKERLANHDPRPSIEERYKDQADFVAKRKQVAAKLVQQGYLLLEDVPVFSAVTLPNPQP
jgi:hypothetical protein